VIRDRSEELHVFHTRHFAEEVRNSHASTNGHHSELTDEEANALLVQAIEVYEMAKRIEDLTKDTTISYAGLRVRVDARAAFEQVEDLRQELEEMGKELGGEVP